MSRRILRYEGEGRRRRPVWLPEGPANGAGDSSLIGSHAAVARLSAVAPSRLVEVGGRVPGGSGAVERRQATDAQREAWRAADAAPAHLSSPSLARPSPAIRDRPALGSPEHLQQSRMRGARRHVEVVASRRPPLVRLADAPVPPPPPEEHVMESAAQPPAVPDPRYEALDELQSAALAAQDALSERAGAQTRLEAADAAWDAARDRLQQAQERVSGWFGSDAAETAPERARVVVDEPALAEELADAREDAAVAAALRDDRLGEPEDRVPHPAADRAATFAVFARDRADAAAGGGSGASGVRQPNAGRPGGGGRRLHGGGDRARGEADVPRRVDVQAPRPDRPVRCRAGRRGAQAGRLT